MRYGPPEQRFETVAQAPSGRTLVRPPLRYEAGNSGGAESNGS
jgi:hypothetical protein